MICCEIRNRHNYSVNLYERPFYLRESFFVDPPSIYCSCNSNLLMSVSLFVCFRCANELPVLFYKNLLSSIVIEWYDNGPWFLLERSVRF
jgi:hypothetical protein